MRPSAPVATAAAVALAAATPAATSAAAFARAPPPRRLAAAARPRLASSSSLPPSLGPAAGIARPARRPKVRRPGAAVVLRLGADDEWDGGGGGSGGGGGFASLGLSDDLVSAARRMGWDDPTPVQRLSVPAILDMAEGDEEEDDGGSGSLWCEGPTGSGKTAGFALPLLQILARRAQRAGGGEGGAGRGGRARALVLCPTRELASQTGRVFRDLVAELPRGKRSASVEVIHGGVSVEAQVARLARARRSGEGLDVVVATPGRLADVLRRGGEGGDPELEALERRIADALDEKASSVLEGAGDRSKRRKGGERRGRRGPPRATSLSLNEIREMDLDRADDDGRASLDEMLRDLDYLVLDEADRLLGGAFREEVDALLSLLPDARAGSAVEEGGGTGESSGTRLKTLLFSATFPDQIEERVDRVLSRLSAGEPLRVSTTASMLHRLPVDEGDYGDDADARLSNRQKKHLANTTPIRNVLPDSAPDIRHRVVRLEERHRTQALLHLLDEHDGNGLEGSTAGGEWDRVLVFVSTRYATEHVSRKLRRHGIKSEGLHGKLDQAARDRRLERFRSGRTRVLVSTDLAARGVDVAGLPCVVHYDLPRSADDFVHRSGRTGRAGRTGTAVTFVTARTEPHFDLIERREVLRGRVGDDGSSGVVEREVIPRFPVDEGAWGATAAAAAAGAPGAAHSGRGLAHDRMFGGNKGRRKSKKDKLREAAAAAAAAGEAGSSES
ncbi:hypothetical protein ACHAWF_009279 [Thalassiosira exigua]